MRSYFKKLITAALTAVMLLSFSLPCAAENVPPEYDVRGKTIDEIVADFMEEFHLTESNFAMGWYNTGTDETWYYNENQYMGAGSMYKLPLCMNYICKFAEGSFDPETKTGGYKLTDLIDYAIRYSDNDAADLLRRYYSRDHITYRKALANFSDVDQDTLPSNFFRANDISPHIILDTLKALYADQDFYRQIIDNMLLAHPEHYFKYYQGEYEIAHKYGYFEGALDDCAIIYTPTPFLLVAFTYNVMNNEKAIGTLAKRMTDYSLWLDAEAERIAAEEAAAEQARIEAERIAAEQAAAERARIAAVEQAKAELAELTKAELAATEQAAADAIAEADAEQAAIAEAEAAARRRNGFTLAVFLILTAAAAGAAAVYLAEEKRSIYGEPIMK